MIIRLNPKANILITEAAVRFFENIGCDVHIKEDPKGIIIVALETYGTKIDLNKLDRVAGIASYEQKNDLFIKTNGEGFIESWEFKQKKG
jgi:hypothetical protein